ncbi:MAG: hypothetical protein Q8R04_01680 [Nanoarchaeota archaeon]|nr:hypothetical protein [Nanoarchaeota archaeon]
MMKFSSTEEWKDYCFSTRKSYTKNKYFCCWSRKKRTDILNCATLKNNDLQNIKKSVENALKLCGPEFKISIANHSLHELDFAVEKGNLIGSRILGMVKKTRKKDKSCNARIFLVNKRAMSDTSLLEFGDALTYVSDGVTIFTFDPSVKYPKKFFKAEVAHEVYHLLGLNIHHYNTQVEGYGKLSRCIMEYNAPSEKLCQKCEDGLLSFWEGVKHATKS